jgi:hypothetical protein
MNGVALVAHGLPFDVICPYHFQRRGLLIRCSQVLEGSNSIEGHGDLFNKPMLHFPAGKVETAIVFGVGQPVDFKKKAEAHKSHGLGKGPGAFTGLSEGSIRLYTAQHKPSLGGTGHLIVLRPLPLTGPQTKETLVGHIPERVCIRLGTGKRQLKVVKT